MAVVRVDTNSLFQQTRGPSPRVGNLSALSDEPGEFALWLCYYAAP